jgi:hypothetical protein
MNFCNFLKFFLLLQCLATAECVRRIGPSHSVHTLRMLMGLAACNNICQMLFVI